MRIPVNFKLKSCQYLFFASLMIYASNSFSQDAKWNLRLGLPSSMIEYGKNNSGYALTFNIWSFYEDIESFKVKYRTQRAGLRYSYYPSGFGKNSFYAAAEGGWENQKATGVNEATQETIVGGLNSTYQMISGGYHLFFKSFNFSLGLGCWNRIEDSHGLHGNLGTNIQVPHKTRLSPDIEITFAKALQ